jgi:hypothetical protein
MPEHSYIITVRRTAIGTKEFRITAPNKTAAAERASSAARRATGLAERELQNLEALGVRLEGESGPVDPAETLGESDFVVEPER